MTIMVVLNNNENMNNSTTATVETTTGNAVETTTGNAVETTTGNAVETTTAETTAIETVNHPLPTYNHTSSNSFSHGASNNHSLTITASSNPKSMAKVMRHMHLRQLERLKGGHYKISPNQVFWVSALVLTFASIFGICLYNQNLVQIWAEHWTQFSLFIFIFPIICYIILKLSLLMKWVFYWLLICTATLFIVNATATQDKSNVSKWIVLAFLIIEILTVLTYVFTRNFDSPKWLTWLTSSNPTGQSNYWTITPIPGRPGHYISKGKLDLKPKKFTFKGETNQEGLPHGYGEWTAEWQFGEVISGYWSHGQPIGPFKSREWKTGHSFCNLRVGLCAVSDGFKSQNVNISPLRYGMASVECSVSGKFFRDLPKARLLMDPFSEKSLDIKQVIDDLYHINDFFQFSKQKKKEIVVKCTTRGFAIPGYVALESKRRIEMDWINDDYRNTHFSSPPRFQLKGWEKEKLGQEVLLFIPGFNGSLEGSTESFGQMLALGGVPNRIRPFIFHWPGGNLLQYPLAVKVAESDKVCESLQKVISSFAEHGFSKVHIIVHSMGARVVTHAAATGALEKVFAPTGDSPSSTLSEFDKEEVDPLKPIIELGSVTFINPEASLDRFINQAYDKLRAVCPLITMYGNGKDIALSSAQYLYALEPIMGRYVYGLKNESPQDEATEDMETSLRDDLYLDMDVIDATNLENNVAMDKHTYFSLNKFVVDDLCELVISGLRANEREHRLIKVDGNVFSFLSAPSFVHQG